MLKTTAITTAFFLAFGSFGIFKTESRGITRERIAVLNFKTENCDPDIGTSAAGILNRELTKLSRNRLFSMIDSKITEKTAQKNGFRQENCYDDAQNCILPAEKRVVGLIDRLEIKTGEEKLAKYVAREFKEEEYSINVKVLDKNNRIEMNIKETTADINELDNILKKVAARIASKYKAIPVKRVEEKKPVIKEAARKPVPRQAPFIEFKGISAAGSYLKGLGKYNDIADAGYGANLSIYFAISPFPNYIALSSDFYMIQDDNNNIKSNYALYPLMKIGHSFKLNDLILTPYAGAGYLISIIYGDADGIDISGNYDYSMDYYYNPAASGGFEINYRFYKDYFLLLDPSYSVFFEKESKGQFLSISLGLRIMLE